MERRSGLSPPSDRPPASGSDYTQVLMALAEHVDDQRETVFIGLPALEFAAPFVGYRIDWRSGSVSANTMRAVRGIAFRHVLSLVIVGNRKCFSNSFSSPINRLATRFAGGAVDFVFAGSSVTGPSAVLVSTASATLEHRDSWAYAFQSYVYPPNPSDFTFLARARPRSHPSPGRRPITFLIRAAISGWPSARSKANFRANGSVASRSPLALAAEIASGAGGPLRRGEDRAKCSLA